MTWLELEDVRAFQLDLVSTGISWPALNQIVCALRFFYGVTLTVGEARAAALEKGITINGLPIMVKEPSYSTMDIDNLDFYYEDCVIGGPGSFVVSIKDREKFKEAIRTKLVLEIAGRTPERPIVPVAEKEPRVNCMIGEKIWQDRWGR